MYFRIRHFRTHHATSRSQKPWQQSPRQEARSVLQDPDEHTARENNKPSTYNLFYAISTKAEKVVPN